MLVASASLFLALVPAAQQSLPSLALPRARSPLLGAEGAELPRTGALGPFADLDGDGDVDFLRGDQRCRNDGAGIFEPGRLLGLAPERRVTFFHADGDGVLDLLSRTHLYRGDGTGGFDDATSALPAGLTADAGLALDIGGNGTFDLLTLQRSNHPLNASVHLALGDGAGSFTDVSTFLPPSPPNAWTLVAGDLDGDGDPDLVLGVHGQEELWRNDGNRLTPVASALPAVNDTTNGLALFDAEGDGDLDLALTGDRLLLNDSAGTFTPGVLPAAGNSPDPFAVLALDREGDGDTDLVVLDESQALPPMFLSYASASRLLVNDGAGGFTSSADLQPVAMHAVAGFAGDLDGDGDADLIVEDAARPNRLFWNDGAGRFTTVGETLDHVEPVVTSTAGALADLDGDGLIDALTPTRVLLNDPPGVLSVLPGTLPPTPADPFGFRGVSDIALGDLDGDGDADAYLCCDPGQFGSDGDRIWINDGSAGFSDQTATRFTFGPETSYPSARARLTDLEGDGDIDLMVVRPADGGSTTYANDGSGVFALRDYLSSGYSGAFGDFDDDGAPDYFQGADWFYSANALYRNDGSGSLTFDPTAIPAHGRPLTVQDVAVGDIDGDGDLDVYAPRSPFQTQPPSVPQPAYVYVNDGAGHFSDEPARLPFALVGRDPALVDLDLDGDADLLASRDAYLNNGHGFFHAAGGRVSDWDAWSAPFPSERMAVADLDLDGDADALAFDQSIDSIGSGMARHLEALGPPRLGKTLTLVVHGSPGTAFVLLESNARARIPLGAAGTLLVDPSEIVFSTRGQLDEAGEAHYRRTLPSTLALLGLTTHWQAFVGRPVHGTNAITTTITGL